MTAPAHIAALTAFRKPHRIEPVPVYLLGGTEPDHWSCDACGVELYRVGDWWRHDGKVTRDLPRPASWPGVA